MKKFIRFLFHTLAIFGLFAGGYYLYQKYVLKDNLLEEQAEEDFDDFDFDDEDFTENASDTREYVTLNASESKNIQKDIVEEDKFDEVTD